MTLRKLALTTVALCALATARPAEAHFLWGEVTVETPAVAKLALSDRPGMPSEDGMVERIKTARAWNGEGKELTLGTEDGVRSAPLKGSTVFSSSQYYGVLDKTKEGRGVFRCMYYAKSALTVEGTGHNLNLPFELFGRRDGTDYIIVTAKRGAEVYPKAGLNVFVPGVPMWKTYTTDEKGEIRFEAKTPGLYGIKAAWVDETAGEVEGKKYPFTRNYSTLTFHVPAAPAG